MADAFIGEIRMFPFGQFGFNLAGWFACNGQKLNLRGNEALYSLIGSRFGGDNQTYFNLPNLNGRIPVDAGTSPTTGTQYVFAQTIGQETVTLNAAQAPSHTHTFSAKNSGAGATGMTGVAGSTGAAPNLVGTSLLSRAATSAPKFINAYDVPPSANETQLGVKVSVGYGNAQGAVDPHPNVQPYLVMAYYICYNGEYPVNPD
jgi:microcystin-dependent protein